MTTTPLAKAITTLEGQLAVLVNVAVITLSAIDPTTLPRGWAGAIAAATTIALTLQRGLVKATALKSASGSVAPTVDTAPVHSSAPSSPAPSSTPTPDGWKEAATP